MQLLVQSKKTITPSEIMPPAQCNPVKLRLARLIWVFVLSFAVLMAFVHCCCLVVVFYEYPVLHQRQYIFNSTLAFPAVTLCSNNPIVWPRIVEEKHILEQILENHGSASVKDRAMMLQEPSVALLYALRNMSEEERIKLGTPISSILMECTLQPESCNSSTNMWYMTSSLYYGNCFTYNHVTDPKNGLFLTEIKQLVFTVHNELGDRMPDLNRDPVMSLLVHPVGTAPVFYDPNVITVAPGDDLQILIEQSVIERLPTPYPSQCVDGFDPEVKKSTIYYRPEKEYIYSIEACLTSCIQRTLAMNCSCIDAKYPFTMIDRMFGKSHPVCTKDISCLNCYSEAVQKTRCGCHLPCLETKLYLSTWNRPRAAMSEVEKQYNYAHSLRKKREDHVQIDGRYTDSQRQFQLGDPLLAVVRIRLKSTIYEKITEVPMLKKADLFGAVGGNIGLWLGISILSLFEMALRFIMKFHICAPPPPQTTVHPVTSDVKVIKYAYEFD